MAAAASELANALPPRRWRFGRVRFDEASYELHVDGRPMEVERKPLDVLRVLLDHHGKVVTKSQLVQLAWPGRVIGDAALAKAVGRLREAIGDSDHSTVRTHHRYGYRLVADVAVEQQSIPTTSIPAEAPVATPAPHLATARSDAEHRVLTMMFCDIVDSTSLAESLDPEAFRDLLVDYQRSTSDIVRRYEGHVAQQFGDGMLFYFGYPLAHDDDAERAVRCACELLQFAGRAGPYTRLAMRIGVHTGAVVIGHAQGGADALATGSHLHVASRLQSLVEPDTILVSDATFRLVPGLFVTRDFGMQSLRGLVEPVRVHQVLHPSGARSRLETQRRLTPFVGRDAELDLVDTRWAEAIEGHGGAILFRGEPGIGKSRLLLELRAHLAGSAHTWLEGRADALNRHSAFHLVAEVLQRGFAMEAALDEAQRLQALERRLADLELAPESAIPLLAPLLGLADSERYPASSLAPDVRRAQTLALLTDWAERLADEQPLVLVFEDLHWCDDSSLEFIGALIARLETLPLLLVMTARPEFVPAWTSTTALRIAPLEGLARSAVEHMLGDLAAGESIAPTLASRIVERAAGVPLFVEELVRALQETGQLSGDEVRDPAVPGSLNSLLRARLDRLGPARDLIQTAAVIGFECDHVLLQRVSGLEESALQAQLHRLTDAGLLLVGSAPPAVRYVFKHALIRDSAYAALLKSTRQNLHARAADAIESLHGTRLDEHCGSMAHHCEQAGQAERAARFAQRAGDIAMRACANREAVTHLSTATRLLESLEPTPTRIQNLLSLYMSLVNVCAATGGYTDPEVQRAHQRASELARNAQRSADLAPVLFWIAAIGTVRGQYAVTVDACAQLDALGKSLGEPIPSMVGCFISGQCHFLTGDLRESEIQLRRALALYDPTTCRDVTLVYGEDTRSSGAATLGFLRGLAGLHDQADVEYERAMAHARKLGHPLNLAIACTLVCFGNHLAGDLDAMAKAGREGVALCREHGIAWYQSYCEIAMASETARHDPVAALVDIRRAIEVFTAGGVDAFKSWVFGTLASVQALAGHYEEALGSLDVCTSSAEATGEGFFRPEVFRLRGEVLRLAHGAAGAAPAEREFRAAVEAARAMGALHWELRAARELARLLAADGRKDEARALLSGVYGRFTEGFDKPDLLEAKVLLDQLG